MKKNTLKDIFKNPITPISIVLFGLMLLQEFERFLTGSKQLNKIKVMKKQLIKRALIAGTDPNITLYLILKEIEKKRASGKNRKHG